MISVAESINPKKKKLLLRASILFKSFWILEDFSVGYW